MKMTIRKLAPGLIALATFSVGLVLGAVLSSRAIQPAKPRDTTALEQNKPQQAAFKSEPVQETISAKEQDCQTCAEDRYCALCGYLDAIEIIRHDDTYDFAGRVFKNLSEHPIYVDLDLGESIENQTILLRGASPYVEFKIEQQFETSLTVMDEGPHLDLTDWKHYRSEWREIKKLDDNKFLTLKLSEADSSRFPKVSMREIYSEVARRGDDKWTKLARSAKTVNDYPLGVGVSKISLRIKVREDNQWRVIKRLEFIIPMGC